MASVERLFDRGTRRARKALLEIGEEFRHGRDGAKVLATLRAGHHAPTRIVLICDAASRSAALARTG